MNLLLLTITLVSLNAAPGTVAQSFGPAGPKDAVLTAVVDAQVLRRSPHRQHYLQVASALPDYPRLVGQANKEPVDVFDRLFVATSDPRKISETVLVACIDEGPQPAKDYLDLAMGQTLKWSRAGGFHTAKPAGLWWVKRESRVLMRSGKVFAFAHPRHGKWFSRAAKSGRGAGFPPPIKGKNTLLVAQMDRIPLALGGRLPAPGSVAVVLEDGQRPRLTLNLHFDQDAQADAFVSKWPSVQRELIQHWELAVLGYTELVARIKVERVDTGAALTVSAEPSEVKRLSRFLATTIRNRTRGHHPPMKAR